MAEVKQIEQVGRRFLERVRARPLLSVAAVGAGALFLAEAVGAAEVAVAVALAYGAFRLVRRQEPTQAT
jgi:hypothetical protein